MNSISLIILALPIGIGVFAFAATWGREYEYRRSVSICAYAAMWLFMGGYTYLIVQIVLLWPATFNVTQ